MLFLFYLFAAVSVVSALLVISLKDPIYSALCLVLCFFCLGGIYVLMNSEFVAIIQVLVYAGAIMVLFLFVLMLLKRTEEVKQATRGLLPKIVGILLGLAILAQFAGVFQSDSLRFGSKGAYPVERVAEEGSISIIGSLLYGEYVLPFELVSILLLVAVIGAVVIAKRRLS